MYSERIVYDASKLLTTDQAAHFMLLIKEQKIPPCLRASVVNKADGLPNHTTIAPSFDSCSRTVAALTSDVACFSETARAAATPAASPV